MIKVVWVISFVIEAALIVRLIRWRVRLPVLRVFLMFDLPRWILLFLLDNGKQSNPVYVTTWRFTEPITILLLAMLGAEAWKRAADSGIRYAEVWVGFAVAPWAIGIAASGANFRVLLAFHALVAGLIAAGLCVFLSSYHSTHVIILTVFCGIEFVGHAAVLAGTVCDARIAAAVILGETACMAGWLWHAKWLSANGGIARLRI